MKITSRKKLIGKLFQSRKNKKASTPISVVGKTGEEEEENDIVDNTKSDPPVKDEEPVEQREGEDVVAASDDAEPSSTNVIEGEERDDIVADSNEREGIEETPEESKGFLGGLLENMTSLCAPIDQPLPTIMSGEEMTLTSTYDDALSPRSTLTTETTPDSPPTGDGAQVLSPLSVATPSNNDQGADATAQKTPTSKPKRFESVEETKDEEPFVDNEDELKVVVATTPVKKDPEPTPRKLAEPPVVETVETEDLETAPAGEHPVTPKTPAGEGLEEEEEDVIADIQPQMSMEPVGTKMDIFAGLTACCNPTTMSMDELEMKNKQLTEGAATDGDAAEVKAGAGIQDPEPSFQMNPSAPSTPKKAETPRKAQTPRQAQTPKGRMDPDGEEPTFKLIKKLDPEDNVTTADVDDVTTKLTAPAEPEEDVQLVTGKIHKEKKNTKMGLSLKNSTMLPGVFIARIKENSLFSETDLREGMMVLKIQGKPCPSVLEEAVSILRHTVGNLEIIAEQPKCEI